MFSYDVNIVCESLEICNNCEKKISNHHNDDYRNNLNKCDVTAAWGSLQVNYMLV